MEDNGWFKPFAAAFIVLGLALLIGWFIFDMYYNKITSKINNTFKKVNNLVGPMIDYFNFAYRYISNPSEELLTNVKDALSVVTDTLNKVGSPDVALKINNLMQQKIRLGYQKGKEEEQRKLNEAIASATNAKKEVKQSIINSLNSIDAMFFQNQGDPAKLRDYISTFTSGLLESAYN
jgi:hypothetical protein